MSERRCGRVGCNIAREYEQKVNQVNQCVLNN